MPTFCSAGDLFAQEEDAVPIITNNHSEARGARQALTWRERSQAYVIADFYRRRLGLGWSDERIWTAVGRLWPNATEGVLDAAELFHAARCDGWPET
jgi:hypothetical protein